MVCSIKHQISTDNLLTQTNIVLRTSFDTLLRWSVPEKNHSELKSVFGKTLYTKFENAADYFKRAEKFHKLKFNIESLDNLLKGGIDTGCVTEIYGKSGSGKTQLCLQLALNCQLPYDFGGLNGKVVYISSDKAFPIKRLVQMEQTLKSKYKFAENINFLDNIFVYELNTKENFEKFVENELSYILSTYYGKVKLLIIDSIAGIYRTETKFLERGQHMCKLFQTINKIADKNNMAIVATNHVTSSPDVLDDADIPAIGNLWSTLLSTRICVKKTRIVKESLNVRTMKVEFSPRLPPLTAKFIVSSDGIESISEDKLPSKKLRESRT